MPWASLPSSPVRTPTVRLPFPPRVEASAGRKFVSFPPGFPFRRLGRRVLQLDRRRGLLTTEERTAKVATQSFQHCFPRRCYHCHCGARSLTLPDRNGSTPLLPQAWLRLPLENPQRDCFRLRRLEHRGFLRGALPPC